MTWSFWFGWSPSDGLVKLPMMLKRCTFHFHILFHTNVYLSALIHAPHQVATMNIYLYRSLPLMLCLSILLLISLGSCDPEFSLPWVTRYINHVNITGLQNSVPSFTFFPCLLNFIRVYWFLWLNYSCFGCGYQWIFHSLLLQRIRIEEIRNDEWFKRGYVPAKLIEYEDVNLDDVNAVFDDPEVCITFDFCFFFIYMGSAKKWKVSPI